MQFSEKPWPPLRNGLLSVLRQHRPHTVYGFGEVDITDALAALRLRQRECGIAVSFHAFILYCLAHAAHEHPQVNTFRYRRKFITFEDVDIGTTIEKRIGGNVRLPIVYVLRAANTKSLAEINWEFRRACRMNPAQDPTIRMRRRLIRLPGIVRNALSAYMSRNPFFLRKIHGTMGLTNLQRPNFNRPFWGMPPNIFTLTFAIGSITDRFLPDAEGKPVLRKMLCLSGAADHAVIDGMDLARFSERFSQLMETGAGLDDAFVEQTRKLKQGFKS
jgi:hypothetical protein